MTVKVLFYAMTGIAFVFSVIGITAYIHAYCSSNNLHSQITNLISSLFQTLVMVADIFACIEAWNVYQSHSQNNNINQQLLLFSICRVTFIVIPISISLYQLYRTSVEEWSKDDRIRQWLKKYNVFLYLISILTGSSFSAIKIVHANLYNLNMFYMGLNKMDIMYFCTKKVYSIILFENLPQFILSVWFLVAFSGITYSYICAIQIVFSIISMLSCPALIVQKRIAESEDYIYISIEIEGKCIVDKQMKCTNNIKWLKKYIAYTVLGVVKVERANTLATENGLKMEMYVNIQHGKDKQEIENQCRRCFQTYIDNNLLAQAMRKQWSLDTDIGPVIKIHQVIFHESKARRQINSNVFKHESNESINLSDEEAVHLNPDTMIDLDVMGETESF